MNFSANEQLRQLQNKVNTSLQTGALGQYQAAIANRPTMPQGLLNVPKREMPNYSEKDFSYFKTPVQAAPSGGGGMSVLCTLMNKYGYLESDVFQVDTIYGELLAHNAPHILIGYHAWAKPLVEILENHPVFIPTFAYFVQAWAYTMGDEMGIVKNRSTFKRLLGKIMMNLGKPLCGFIGHIILSMQGSYEYRRT